MWQPSQIFRQHCDALLEMRIEIIFLFIRAHLRVPSP